MVHAFQLLFIDCNYPRAFVWWIGMHAVMFFFLFNEFYKSTYKAKQDRVSIHPSEWNQLKNIYHKSRTRQEWLELGERGLWTIFCIKMSIVAFANKITTFYVLEPDSWPLIVMILFPFTNSQNKPKIQN